MKHQKRIYELTKKIPKGKVSTYNSIAKKVKTSPRHVGNVLHINPYKSVPCHRVIKSNLEIGGFASGTKNKIQILKKEGIKINNKKTTKEFLFLFR